MSHSREMRQLITKLGSVGCKVDRTGNGRYRIKTPDGHLIIAASTPSDRRTILNVKSMLRQHGIEIEST